MEKLKWKTNTLPKDLTCSYLDFFNESQAEKARQFHSSFDQYSVTPLCKSNNLAKKIGLSGVYVKDESYRFGLNAFKVLGGSYAIGCTIAKQLEMTIDELPYNTLKSKAIKEKIGDVTFFTATDGNHGRGVAWAARELNQKSVVYMPKGSSLTRLENIKNEGAIASITDMNYDDAVRLAAKNADEDENGLIIQDTAWEGYTDIPKWIMQGYTTMAIEALEQLENYNVNRPTHIFIQAGVGSLAGAIQGFFTSKFRDSPPKVIVCESNLADCFYKSAVMGNGKPQIVGGDMQTIMAGLACGEPNIIGFDLLKNYADMFISVPDWVAEKGMKILGNPLNGDDRVISGESGAVTTGVLYEIMTNKDYIDLRNELELDENSNVLLFSTEGDTDPDKYREICWNGTY